jgi:hypothetical protein
VTARVTGLAHRSHISGLALEASRQDAGTGGEVGRSSGPRSVMEGSVVLFGTAHLPQAAAIRCGLSASLVAVVLLGNGPGGMVFGWLYWKRGLLAAVSAHFAADIALHRFPIIRGSRFVHSVPVRISPVAVRFRAG